MLFLWTWFGCYAWSFYKCGRYIIMIKEKLCWWLGLTKRNILNVIYNVFICMHFQEGFCAACDVMWCGVRDVGIWFYFTFTFTLFPQVYITIHHCLKISRLKQCLKQCYITHELQPASFILSRKTQEEKQLCQTKNHYVSNSYQKSLGAYINKFISGDYKLMLQTVEEERSILYSYQIYRESH